MATNELVAGTFLTIRDLTESSVGMEPTYDVTAWQKRKELNLFVQNVGQGQAEGV